MLYVSVIFSDPGISTTVFPAIIIIRGFLPEYR